MPPQIPHLYVLLLIIVPPHFVQFAAALPPSPPLSEADALLSFKSSADPGGGRLHFSSSANHSASAKCSWPGVSCSADGRVVRLVFESLGLNGTFPNSTLGRLDQLRVLSLKFNSLTGPIPNLSALVNLKALFLSHNLFSGPFPSSLAALHRLRILDLSHNLLSGHIPSGLTSLDRLYSLLLDSNLLSGPLPPFNQSSLKIFNVSANDLSGAVPVTAVLSAFGPAAFSRNVRLCGAVLRRVCGSHFPFFQTSAAAPSPTAPRLGFLLPGSNSSTAPPQRTHKKAVMAAGLFACAAILAILLLGISVAVRKKKKKRSMGKNGISDVGVGDDEMEARAESTAEEVEDRCNELVAAAAMTEEKMKRLGKSGCLVFCAGEAPVYTLEQLMRASAEMLGRGSVGSTYKAVLDNRLVLCVKRLDSAKIGIAGKEGFERHMEAVGRLRHPNLVPLRAFFQAKEERLLVYDYQPNGSLHSLIHGSRSTRAKPLHWTSCLKIAEDVAQGLSYIHQASRLVHGNIRSSNVLLGSDFEACLADNCLSFLADPAVPDDDSGYRAPETRKSNRRLTPRSDIYAFGVLLLELLTGKPPLQQQALVAADLPGWVRSVRDDEGGDDERLRMIVDIAAACVRSSPESRPTTWQVLKMIQEVKEADMGDDESNDSGIS